MAVHLAMEYSISNCKESRGPSMMIDEFKGEYAFLSNLHPAPVEYEDVTYPTVEHAFQAAKTELEEERDGVKNAKSAAAARMLGKRVTLRRGWDYHRVDVMDKLVRAKF